MFTTINTDTDTDTSTATTASTTATASTAFKAACRQLVGAARGLEAATKKLGEVLPPLLAEAAQSGLLSKPTAKACALLCLTEGGMNAPAAATWVSAHIKTIELAWGAVRPTLIETGTPGLKAGKTKTASKPVSKPAPVSKTAATPTGSPLASDLAFQLSCASTAALSAAWESLPLSTRTKVLEAFQA